MSKSDNSLYRPRRSGWFILAAVALCVTAAALLAACGGVEDSVAAAEARSDMERAVPSAVSADLAALADGNSAFAFDLYHALRGQEGNLLYSPHSISLALAMTHAGARGETERQMAETLRFVLPPDRLHPAFNALDQELASRGQGLQDEDGEGFRLNIVNAVWGQREHPFREPFLDVLAESYGAGVRQADFREMPEESRLAINDWVAESTEDRIKDLIPPDVINSLTRMVLTNAIYFNASWLFPFNEANTRQHPFHLLGGSSVEVPMMGTSEDFGYAAGDGYQAVDLPYAGNELSMTVLLPDEGRFREFEESLDSALAERIIADLWFRRVTLDLPRFEFESEFRLGETLRAMGMSDAFDSAVSDFSGMDGRSCLGGRHRVPLHPGGGAQGIRVGGRGGHRGGRGHRRHDAGRIRSPGPGQGHGGQALHLPDPGPGDRGRTVRWSGGGAVGWPWDRRAGQTEGEI